MRHMLNNPLMVQSHSQGIDAFLHNICFCAHQIISHIYIIHSALQKYIPHFTKGENVYQSNVYNGKHSTICAHLFPELCWELFHLLCWGQIVQIYMNASSLKGSLKKWLNWKILMENNGIKWRKYYPIGLENVIIAGQK